MSLVAAWLAFPLLLLALSVGCGLLVERLAGTRVRGVLLPPLGGALMIVVSQAATYWNATAELATPAVVALAALGLALARERIRAPEIDLWPAAAAAAVFAVFAAPVVLSGDATFAGYTLLGDASIHFILVDRLMEHGRDLSGLAPSSYRAALRGYFDTAYPVGAHAALGAVRPLVGQDVSAVFQPFLAFLAAMVSLALYALIGGFPISRPWRAAIAFVGAQPALVYAYGLQGGIKEIATVLVVTTLFALVPLVLAEGGGARRLFPLAVVSGAGLGVLGLAIVPWLGPLLLVCAAALAWRRRPAWVRSTARDALVFAAATVVLSVPVLAQAGDYLGATEDVVTSQTEFGNLLGPLRRLQAVGIWPAGDFRLSLDPSNEALAHILIVVAVAAAVIGIAWGVRRRVGVVLLWVTISAVAWAYVTSRGSPWADAKALMIVSPTIVVTALIGASALLAWRRWAGLPVVAAIAVGVLWSNALAYHDVRLAPHDRFDELRSIGPHIDGRGPTLYTEFEEFAKHFLRKGDPTGWSEAWQDGTPAGRFGFSADPDELPFEYTLRYRTLVLRRSPARSRPPAPFRLVERGRYYEVWERAADGEKVTAHLGLGAGPRASSKPRCGDVRALGRRASRTGARLAFAPRAQPLVLQPANAPLPGAWVVDRQDPLTVQTVGPGRISLPLSVDEQANYAVWLQGSFGRPVRLQVDGREVGSVEYELNGSGQYAWVGRLPLAPGAHTVTVSRGGGSLRPGNGDSRPLGPIAFDPEGAGGNRVVTANPRDVGDLCRRYLDWLEVVARSG